MGEVDTYISGFSSEIQERLHLIRNAIREIAPQTVERICMKMPTYDLNGKWFIHFAAFQKHIGIYPQPEGVEAFQDKLKEYKTSKGTIQFPLSKPLPIELIREIIRFRLEQEMQTEDMSEKNK